MQIHQNKMNLICEDYISFFFQANTKFVIKVFFYPPQTVSLLTFALCWKDLWELEEDWLSGERFFYLLLSCLAFGCSDVVCLSVCLFILCGADREEDNLYLIMTTFFARERTNEEKEEEEEKSPSEEIDFSIRGGQSWGRVPPEQTLPRESSIDPRRKPL